MTHDLIVESLRLGLSRNIGRINSGRCVSVAAVIGAATITQLATLAHTTELAAALRTPSSALLIPCLLAATLLALPLLALTLLTLALALLALPLLALTLLTRLAAGLLATRLLTGLVATRLHGLTWLASAARASELPLRQRLHLLPKILDLVDRFLRLLALVPALPSVGSHLLGRLQVVFELVQALSYGRFAHHRERSHTLAN